MSLCGIYVSSESNFATLCLGLSLIWLSPFSVLKRLRTLTLSYSCIYVLCLCRTLIPLLQMAHHNTQTLAGGSFGKVYREKYNDKWAAVKRVPVGLIHKEQLEREYKVYW